MAGLVIAGWHHAHASQRVFGLVGVVLVVVSAGSSVNQTFQYYPTLDRLLGKQADNFMSNSTLNAMRAEVARTGKLPADGATISVPIPDPNLNYKPREAFVWLPPAWFAPHERALPVIELLHGSPGEPSDWTRADYADSTSLAFAEQHNGVAPILVMPDVTGSFWGDSECVNSKQYGNVETYLTKTVPAFMQKNFNTSTQLGSMAIAGLSAGGTCATIVALNNPKEFPTFASYSGFASPTYQEDDAQQTIKQLFGGSEADYDAHNPDYLLNHDRFAGMAGWFESGLQDPSSLQAARTLAAIGPKAGMDTCLADPPGGHDFSFWKQSFADSLPWMSWRLNLTPQPTSVPAHCVSANR